MFQRHRLPGAGTSEDIREFAHWKIDRDPFKDLIAPIPKGLEDVNEFYSTLDIWIRHAHSAVRRTRRETEVKT